MLSTTQIEQIKQLDQLLAAGALKSSIHFAEYSEQKTRDMIAGTPNEFHQNTNEFGPITSLLHEIAAMQRDILNLKSDLLSETTRHNKLKEKFVKYVDVHKKIREREHNTKFSEIENFEYQMQYHD